LTSLCFALVPAVVACSGSTSSPDTGNEVAASVSRNLHPSVPSADTAALVTGNTDFAFGLYKGLASTTSTPEGNLFYSPYSVSLALAMTYAGAGGATATQMAEALGFTLPESRLSPAFDALDLAIETKPASAVGADGASFALNLADALWGDETVKFAPTYVNTLAANFGAGLRTVDFVHQSTAAEAAINAWVSSETGGHINPLLAPGDVNPSTQLVLVNAVYFNAGWGTAFDATATKVGTFTRADGSTVQAPLMSSGSTATTYMKGKNYQAVELPYSGGTTSMIVVLPDTGALSAVEGGLGGSFFTHVTSQLSSNYSINLTIPKFTIHGASVSLVPMLQGLGMKDAFEAGTANFDAMIPGGGTYISDVIHQAFIDVDESGTVAAAATGVIGTASIARETIDVTVDVNRTFFLFIRDVATNTILFAGREDDPTAQ
jgi:serpin B